MSDLVLMGVKIDLPSHWCMDGDVKNFMTPAWDGVLEFYPKWVEAMKESGQQPWPIQPYMLGIAKELEKAGAREGRTADQWMNRFFEHFGVWYLEKYVKQYGDLVPRDSV